MKTLWGAKESTIVRISPEELQHPLDEQIRKRAYELYEQRGRIDGQELDDWLQAELELNMKAAA
ncbi:MAG TPA: DUF2934 domain-containing protein [Terriglobales bacterium]|jgi:hypothetical protein